MAPPPPAGEKQNQLPPKENALFKRIVKCYEHKQYKNGLKFAKQILCNPKFAEHGETLAMKGLILNCLGKREEAYEHVRRGLRNDLRSHVCWHVFGLLQRGDKKYDEAIKAYRNALKWDKDNIQILRDLSLLQVQMRDLDGYRDTRYQLFVLRPTQRASWIGYATAHHLCGDYDSALRVLEEFRKTQTIVKVYDYETSELLLYENLIYREAGRYQDALDHLYEYRKMIHDILAYSEVEVDLLTKLNRKQEAAYVYEKLIERNQENLEYFRGLERVLELDNAARIDDRHALYQDHILKYSKSMAPRRLPLNFLIGAKFRSLLHDYMKHSLRKGAPPLFVDLSSLYCDKEKVRVIEDVATTFLKNLTTVGKFEASDSEPEECPSTVLWVYYYLSQHFDHLGQPQLALDQVESALRHTPTLIELSVIKAKIYKHAGSPTEAARWMDEAQSMDTADRYLNSKSAKYLLKANRIKDAEAMAAKFTREGVNPVDNLNEMQCMWFQTECAKAFRRLGQFGEALKKCHEVDRHFTDIIEDQFDFHTYCIRKMTLSSYWYLLKLEDTLRRHPFYYKAAKCAIKVYLRLHEKPYDEHIMGDGLNAESIDNNDAKKLKNKQRKAAKKAEQAKEAAKQAAERQQQHMKAKQKEANAEPDPDAPILENLEPDKLAKTDKPLEEALKFLTPLIMLGCKHADVFVLGFEIYYRKEKPLLMLQCIKMAHRQDPLYPGLHLAMVKFLYFVSTHSLSEPISEIFKEELINPIFETTDPYELNKKYCAKHDRSLPHRLAIAESMYFLNKMQSEAVTLATDLNESLTGRTWRACKKVLTRLCNGSSFGVVPNNIISAYKDKCHEIFPISAAFAPPVTVVSANHCDNHIEMNSEEPEE